MSNLDLSVVIVNYRSWEVLTKCLDSFVNFTPKLNYEIIVVDNDSQDGHFESFVENFPYVTFIKNSGNNGFSHGCNLGASNSHGEYLLFLNPDTTLTKSCAIEAMLKFAKNNPTVGITSCRRINQKGRLEREISFTNPWLIISWVRSIYKLISKVKIEKLFPKKEAVWYPDWVSGSVILIQSNLFSMVGKWSQESFWMYYEDVDLCRKVKSHSKEIALLRDVEIKHAHGGSSRKNPKTTAITKSEVVTSCHVYIQLHTKGINRIALHLVIILDTLLSQLLRVTLTCALFWGESFRINILVLISTLKYYMNTLKHGTWKSKRLILNG